MCILVVHRLSLDISSTFITCITPTYIYIQRDLGLFCGQIVVADVTGTGNCVRIGGSIGVSIVRSPGRALDGCCAGRGAGTGLWLRGGCAVGVSIV